MKMNRTTITSKIPGNATPRALIDIFRPSFLEITLNGLRTFMSLTTLMDWRLLAGSMNEIMEIATITKSS